MTFRSDEAEPERHRVDDPSSLSNRTRGEMEPLFPVRSPASAPSDAVLLIQPYRTKGTWVFDEPRFGLVREPFVSGVTEIIDRLVADLPDAADGFRLLFSAAPFAGYQTSLTLVERDPVEGHWYQSQEGDKGWLCPALLWFFPQPSEKIYVRAEPRPRAGVCASPAL